MSKIDFHGDLTLKKFWTDWFGIEGRELGSDVVHSFGATNDKLSHRTFTNKPEVYFQFIDWCQQNQHACWITSQPMRAYGLPFGIEKIFFDFDYHLAKNENMTPSKREKVKQQVMEFVDSLDYEPLIVGTRKGFHVYVFLRRTYEFEPRNIEFAKDTFGVIGLTLLGMPKLYAELEEEDRTKWNYVDFGPLGDIMRMARVPLTNHEKTGFPCLILNRKLEPTKVRSLDLYRAYGIREDKVREAVDIVKIYRQKQIAKQLREVKEGAKAFEGGNGFHGIMRPCFTERLKIGEMTHQQRLALLMEAYASGFKSEEQLVAICRSFKDFDDKISREQIRWFLKRKAGKFPPYQCATIESHGWCLKDECPIYQKRKEKHL
jgi:hypothetical protein